MLRGRGVGGLWNAAAGRLGLSLGVAFTLAATAVIAASLATARWLFGRDADVAPVSEAAARAAGVAIAWRPVVLIGIAMACMYIGGVAGVVGGPAGWRAAFAVPLVLTAVIAALAGGFSMGMAPRAGPVPGT